MTRKSDPREARLPVPAGELPHFTPVPRKCQRHDGWTAERQQRFIEALADSGSVRAAARAVNMSAEGAYYLRRQAGATSFRRAWEAALDLGVQRIEDTAMDRALNGVEVPVYSYGKLVGTRIVHNDRLLMFMLRNRAPGRFAEGRAKSLNAVDKMELARLRTEWRKQWEREQGAEQMKRECETIASINAKIDLLRAKEEAYESPGVRAARAALDEAIAADRAALYNPRRDPGHEKYRDDAEEPGPENDFGIVWEDEEEDDDGAAADTGDGAAEGEEDAYPRLRSLKDDGWE